MIRMYISSLACLASLIGATSVHAQGQPLTWRYQMQNGVSTATYPGDIQVIGKTAYNKATADASQVSPQIKLGQTITGTATLGQPATGYNYVLNAASEYATLINYSGWNQSTNSNSGRTGVSPYVALMENRGNGDTIAYYANCNIFAPAGKVGATHWLANPACVGNGANMATLVPHTYLQGGEYNYNDNGVDAAAIHWVGNFNRTVNTASFGEVWMGERWQSLGTKAIDVGWSGSGLVNVGLDTVNATADAAWAGGKTVTVNMSADQRITFNSTSTPLNGVSFYGNVLGTAYDTYSSGSGYLARCNNSGCLNINATNFLGAATNAAGLVTMGVTNSSAAGPALATVRATVGGGNFGEVKAAATSTALNSNNQQLALSIADVPYFTIATTGVAAFARTVQLATYTVGTLPACVAGLRGGMAYVTDATAPTYNGALVGGGAVVVPVFCNGSAWTSH